MIDHASVFTEIVHPYLPNVYIPIYRSCTSLFTNFSTLLFTDYTYFSEWDNTGRFKCLQSTGRNF
jgi:hypothetical protein